MAERKTEFAYRNIEIYKSQSLGSGSYGGVCKAKCDGLPCAAKIMHPTLFDLHDTGAVSYLTKFHEECHFLSLARHPNVVQYLTTCYDPDTRLPVLLMELCDESLTAFLERSPGPLSYHNQLNICHDIALALVYLHSNCLIHRDLTGNNVLMIAGPRAKITDFGMSKLASVNPRMTALTLCPGNVLYMSPEALDEAKTYTAKLDVFSFGVIVIQILTRQFPNPTDRFRIVEVAEFEEEVRMVVLETERREAHLKLIPDTHSLKPLALQCLRKKERQRPSAVQLSERLSELKQSSQYRESMHQTHSDSGVQQLQFLAQAKTREVQNHQTRNTELQSMVEEQQRTIDANIAELQTIQHALANNDHMLQKKSSELRNMQQHLQTCEADFQLSLQQKDEAITELQQTILQKTENVQKQQNQLKTMQADIEKLRLVTEQKEAELKEKIGACNQLETQLCEKEQDMQKTLKKQNQAIHQDAGKSKMMPTRGSSSATSQSVNFSVGPEVQCQRCNSLQSDEQLDGKICTHKYFLSAQTLRCAQRQWNVVHSRQLVTYKPQFPDHRSNNYYLP